MKANIQQSVKFSAVKGFSYKKANNILLTKMPDLGVIFYLEYCVRFYDGEKYSTIHQTENQISAIVLRDNWLAIGEKMFKGQLTTTTVIDLLTKKVIKFKYQKTITTSLSVSKDGIFLSSVGKTDETKQQIFLLSLNEEKVIYSEEFPKKEGKIVGVTFSNKDENLLAILFVNKCIIAKIDEYSVEKKLIKSNKIRQFSMMIFDPWDSSFFICSKNGDISEMSLELLKQIRVGPRKRVIIAGIKHIRFLSSNKLIITGVKGFISLIEIKELRILKEATINEEIVSLTQFEGELGFISTEKANIYIINGQTLNIKSFFLCHSSKINQICFLENFADVFATCAGSQIRVWKTSSLQPILNIQLPKKSCLCLNLTRDGKYIIGGWSDDCIRFFSPTKGKMLGKIENAHSGSVTALISNTSSDRLFSGGDNGSVRIWKLEKERFGLLEMSFSGKSRIHHFELYDTFLYACNEEGSFMIWDIKKFQKITEHKINNFLKQIKVVDNFTLYGVGSGTNFMRIRKNDGQIIEKKAIGGSHINCFDVLNEQLYFFGGEKNQLLLLKKIVSLESKQDMRFEEYDTFSEITAVKIASDCSKVIVGTLHGFLLSFDIEIKQV